MKKIISTLLVLLTLLSSFAILSASADEAKLQTPQITGFESSKDGITITWSAIENAEKYRIYYKGRNGWTRMATTDKTSYFDADVSLGTTYAYTVRCINAAENSFTSDYNTTGWKHTHYLDSPVITGFESSSSGVNIKWNAVDGAAKYRVYYKGKNGWTRMATTDKTSYLDTDVSYGSTYTYTVRCVNAEDSKFISSFNGEGWKYTYNLDTPQITGFKSIGKGVEISWSKIAGAEKYRVYYKGSNGWTKIGETTGTSFIDDDVKVGSTYRYTVRCINSALTKFTSGFKADGWTYKYDPQLDTPVITKTEAEAKGIRISWRAVGDADLYRVYYKGSKGWTKMADTRDTSYLDTDVSKGHTYTYTVRCLSQGGKGFASDYDHNGAKIYLFPDPEIENIAVYMDRIEVGVFANRCHNVRIYRKTGSGSWTRIGEINSEEDGVFVDKNVEPNKTYTYTARCVDENGVFKSYFNTAGEKISFNAENCLPELEFFIYNGENMALVQPKYDNKLGLTRFDMHVMIDGDYSGSFTVTNEPNYIRADFYKADREYLIYLVGVDENGDAITRENSFWVETYGAPTDFKAVKLGDRKYRLTWKKGAGSPEGYYVSVISPDGESAIESELIKGYSYDIDLSGQPGGTEWKCLVWATSSDEISASWTAQLDIRD